MVETTHQIETYIEKTREDLGSNVRELEHKIKSVTDWRQQFQKHPMTLVAVAFGGGIVLAGMLGGPRRRHRVASLGDSSAGNTVQSGTDRQKHQALETWDNIKGALIGVAATRFKDFVADIVPGFHEQFQKTEHENVSAPISGSVRAPSTHV
jgi:hypothetical protein